MRQVDRATVDKPPRLSGDLTAAIEAVRQGQEARGDIYAHEDVVLRLQRLYLRKCYLCERELTTGGAVEHFLPWHKSYPERAYLWENLHWSCNDCNQRKRSKPYRVPAHPNQAAERTDLIDPSAPPLGKRVEDLLTFNPLTSEAGARAPGEMLADTTAQFLNDKTPLHARSRRRAELGDAIIGAECATIWREIADLPSILIETWTEEERKRRLPALRSASGIHDEFLRESAPFGVAMREAVVKMTGLSAGQLGQLSDAYRSHGGLPRAPL